MDKDYREKVQWLNRYQNSLRKERLLRHEIEQLRGQAEGISPTLSGMPHGGGPGDPLGKAVAKLVDMQAELYQQIDTGVEIRKEIEKVVDAMPSERDQELLRRRYILGQSRDIVAVEMHYSYKHIGRLQLSAIMSLNVP